MYSASNGGSLRMNTQSNFPSSYTLRLAELEPLAGIGKHLQRSAATERDAIAQEQVRLLEIGELPATSRRRKQHRKCGVLRKFDLRDRVHHDGKT